MLAVDCRRGMRITPSTPSWTEVADEPIPQIPVVRAIVFGSLVLLLYTHRRQKTTVSAPTRAHTLSPR